MAGELALTELCCADIITADRALAELERLSDRRLDRVAFATLSWTADLA